MSFSKKSHKSTPDGGITVGDVFNASTERQARKMVGTVKVIDILEDENYKSLAVTVDQYVVKYQDQDGKQHSDGWGSFSGKYEKINNKEQNKPYTGFSSASDMMEILALPIHRESFPFSGNGPAKTQLYTAEHLQVAIDAKCMTSYQVLNALEKDYRAKNDGNVVPGSMKRKFEKTCNVWEKATAIMKMNQKVNAKVNEQITQSKKQKAIAAIASQSPRTKGEAMMILQRLSVKGTGDFLHEVIADYFQEQSNIQEAEIAAENAETQKGMDLLKSLKPNTIEAVANILSINNIELNSEKIEALASKYIEGRDDLNPEIDPAQIKKSSEIDAASQQRAGGFGMGQG